MEAKTADGKDRLVKDIDAHNKTVEESIARSRTHNQSCIVKEVMSFSKKSYGKMPYAPGQYERIFGGK